MCRFLSLHNNNNKQKLYDRMTSAYMKHNYVDEEAGGQDTKK